MSYREINLGKVFDGMSSYQLAVKHGKFTGTEEQYVAKEQESYDKMVEYGNNLKEEMDGIASLPDKVTKRMNNIGTIKDTMLLDSIYQNNTTSTKVGYNDDGSLSYTCNDNTGMYMGFETEQDGIQLKLDLFTGLSIRHRRQNTWSDWSTFVTATNKEES